MPAPISHTAASSYGGSIAKTSSMSEAVMLPALSSSIMLSTVAEAACSSQYLDMSSRVVAVFVSSGLAGIIIIVCKVKRRGRQMR